MKAITEKTWIPLGAAAGASVFLVGGIMFLDSISAKTNQTAERIDKIEKTYAVESKENSEVMTKIREDLVEIKTDLKYIRRHQ